MRGVVVVSALLALVLASCSGGASPPDPRPTTRTIPRDPGQLDVLPDFRPAMTEDVLISLLGEQAMYAREPKTTDRMLTWPFESYVALPDGGQEHLTLLVEAEIVRSHTGSSIERAQNFYETGMLDPEKFTDIDIAGADEAAMSRKFEEFGDALPYNQIRITTRARNAVIGVRYMNPTISQQELTTKAKSLVAGLVAEID